MACSDGLVFFVFAVSLGQAAKDDPDVLVRELRKREQIVLTRLKEDATWNDANKVELVRMLQFVKDSRSGSFAPVLVKHLDYSPYTSLDRTMPARIRYPAYGALEAIGLPAVQVLLDELKTVDPEEPKGRGRRLHNLIVYCLADIYNAGGYGRILAKQRIDLEIENTPEKDRALLKEAAKHSWLTEK
ncbi:MAG: hypothetical protein K2R98_24630 [Gemmataceae bacterium]|nr:hypothetical protein [Gemmataceae bacterium]